MITIIISAYRKSESLMNKYRHKLLKRYLEVEGYQVHNGTGSIEGETEPICILHLESPLLDDEIDMLETLATLFDQDYYLVVQNDVAYQYGPGGILELGVWWNFDDRSIPPSTAAAVKAGTFTRNEATGEYFGIQTPAMAKADAFTAAEKACELAGGCKCDTHRVRSFIYGTPEWLERSAAAARSYKY